MRGDLLGLTAKEPRRIPERRFGSVAQSNGGGGIKEAEIVLRTRVAKTNPQSVGLLPFVPRPPKAKGTRKFFRVKHPKATILLRPTNRVPLHFALGTRSLVST